MLTVVAAWAPWMTPAGSVPMVRLTDSPSSLSVSWVAVNVISLAVSPLSNVTLVVAMS